MKEEILKYISKKRTDVIMPRKKITYNTFIDAVILDKDNAHIILDINKLVFQKHMKKLFPEKKNSGNWYKYIEEKFNVFSANNENTITGELLNKFKKNYNNILYNETTFGQYFDDIQIYGKDTLKQYNANTRMNEALNKYFSEKPKHMGYHTYLLKEIGLIKCGICNNIKSKENFKKEYNCISCTRQELAHWRAENKKHIKAYDRLNSPVKNAKRRASKLKATPKWYEKLEIEKLYKQSSKEVHIDHILPLVNKIVCGLHCIDNLQALPAKENLEKSNKFEQDFESMEHMEWLIDHGEAC